MKYHCQRSIIIGIAYPLLVIVLASLIPSRLQAQVMQDRQFDAISRLIEKADAALNENKTTEATQLYGATIAAYRDFADRFPDFQTELVQFRVSYCRQQLMNLLANKKAQEGLKSSATATDSMEQDIRQCIEFCREGRFDDADRTIQAVITTHPGSTQALLVMATARLGKGDMVTAKKLLDRVLALEPDTSAAHYNLAQLMLRDVAPDFDQAKKHYLEAVRLGTPPDPDLETVLDL